MKEFRKKEDAYHFSFYTDIRDGEFNCILQKVKILATPADGWSQGEYAVGTTDILGKVRCRPGTLYVASSKKDLWNGSYKRPMGFAAGVHYIKSKWLYKTQDLNKIMKKFKKIAKYRFIPWIFQYQPKSAIWEMKK